MPYEIYLAHHGIKGQSWGVRNGPPYPLEKGKGISRKKAKRDIAYINNIRAARDKTLLTAANKELKKNAKRSAAVTGAAAGVIAAQSGAVIAGGIAAATLSGVALGPTLALSVPVIVGTAATTALVGKGSADMIKALDNPKKYADEMNKKISNGIDYLKKNGFDVEERDIDIHYIDTYNYVTTDYGTTRTKEYRLKEK